MTRFQRGYNNSGGGGGVLDLTDIKPSSNINSTATKIFCEFCDVPLIKKMDDSGDLNEKRYICCKCGNIRDPLRLGDLDNLKRGERGHTIRSSSSSSSSSDDSPFVEMFNSSNNTSTTNNDKGSLRKGTQLSRALSQTDNINNDDDLEPNEDSIMRGQNNMRILRTETTYPESGRKVVKTFDD